MRRPHGASAEISHDRYLEIGLGDINPSRVTEFLQKNTPEGLADVGLYGLLETWEGPVYVISLGLEECIKHVLNGREVEHIYSNAYPGKLILRNVNKSQILQDLRVKHPDDEFIYVGDGTSDIPVTKGLVDVLFAKQGCRLGRFCKSQGIPHVEYSTLHDVSKVLVDTERIN